MKKKKLFRALALLLPMMMVVSCAKGSGDPDPDPGSSGPTVTTLVNEVSLTIADKVYDGQALAPSATATSGTPVFSYKVSGGSEWSDVAPKDAGTYVVRAKVEANGNYGSGEATKTVTISPKEVSLSWTAPSNLHYDGNAKVPSCAVSANSLVAGDTCSVNIELLQGNDNINAGSTFKFKAISLSNANYKLPASGLESPSYYIVASNSISITLGDKVYDGQPVSPVINADHGTPVIQYSIRGSSEKFNEAPVSVGDYTVYASVEGTADYEGAENQQDFSITQREVALMWTAPSTLKYNGEAHVPTCVVSANSIVNGDAVNVTIALADGCNNVSQGSTFHYVATGLSNANYKLPANASSPDYTIVSPDAKEPNSISLDVSDKVYDKNPINVVVSAAHGTVTLSYSVRGSAFRFSETPASADDYTVYAEVAATAEYEAATAQADFTISKKEIKVNWYAPASLIMDGSPKVPSWEVDSSSVISGDAVNVNAILNPGDDNVHLGTFRYMLNEISNDNYKLPENVYSPVYEIVDKHQNTIHLNIGSKTYDGQPIGLGPVSADYGDVYVNYSLRGSSSYLGGTPINAGQYTLHAYVEEGPDYYGATLDIDFEIYQRQISGTWNAPSSLVFDGSPKVPSFTINTSSIVSGDSVDVSVGLVAGNNNVDAGSTFRFELTGISNSNYKLPADIYSPEYTITNVVPIDPPAPVREYFAIAQVTMSGYDYTFAFAANGKMYAYQGFHEASEFAGLYDALMGNGAYTYDSTTNIITPNSEGLPKFVYNGDGTASFWVDTTPVNFVCIALYKRYGVDYTIGFTDDGKVRMYAGTFTVDQLSSQAYMMESTYTVDSETGHLVPAKDIGLPEFINNGDGTASVYIDPSDVHNYICIAYSNMYQAAVTVGFADDGHAYVFLGEFTLAELNTQKPISDGLSYTYDKDTHIYTIPTSNFPQFLDNGDGTASPILPELDIAYYGVINMGTAVTIVYTTDGNWYGYQGSIARDQLESISPVASGTYHLEGNLLICDSAENGQVPAMVANPDGSISTVPLGTVKYHCIVLSQYTILFNASGMMFLYMGNYSVDQIVNNGIAYSYTGSYHVDGGKLVADSTMAMIYAGMTFTINGDEATWDNGGSIVAPDNTVQGNIICVNNQYDYTVAFSDNGTCYLIQGTHTASEINKGMAYIESGSYSIDGDVITIVNGCAFLSAGTTLMVDGDVATVKQDGGGGSLTQTILDSTVLYVFHYTPANASYLFCEDGNMYGISGLVTVSEANALLGKEQVVYYINTYTVEGDTIVVPEDGVNQYFDIEGENVYILEGSADIDQKVFNSTALYVGYDESSREGTPDYTYIFAADGEVYCYIGGMLTIDDISNLVGQRLFHSGYYSVDDGYVTFSDCAFFSSSARFEINGSVVTISYDSGSGESGSGEAPVAQVKFDSQASYIVGVPADTEHGTPDFTYIFAADGYVYCYVGGLLTFAAVNDLYGETLYRSGTWTEKEGYIFVSSDCAFFGPSVELMIIGENAVTINYNNSGSGSGGSEASAVLESQACYIYCNGGYTFIFAADGYVYFAEGTYTIDEVNKMIGTLVVSQYVSYSVDGDTITASNGGVFTIDGTNAVPNF